MTIGQTIKEYVTIRSQIDNLKEKEKELYEYLLENLKEKTTVQIDGITITASIGKKTILCLPEQFLPRIDINKEVATFMDGSHLRLKEKEIEVLFID